MRKVFGSRYHVDQYGFFDPILAIVHLTNFITPVTFTVVKLLIFSDSVNYGDSAGGT